VTVLDASLGKNSLFFPQGGGGGRMRRPHARGRAVAGVGVGGRGARREGGAGKPPLSAVTAALRVRLGIASDLSAFARRGKYQIGLTPRSSHREFASTDDLTV
jgi:hypothetical protein